jgi:hypothetical protein
MEPAVRADRGACADVRACADPRALADLGALLDDRAGFDACAGCDARRARLSPPDRFRANGSGGLSSCETRAKYAYGLSQTILDFWVSASASALRITADAAVFARASLNRGLEKNAISPCAARSSGATCRISTSWSPATRPPRREAISASVSAMSFCGGGLAFQRLDHPVGEIDARVRIDRVLEDDVVLLLVGDRADRAVRLLEHLRQPSLRRWFGSSTEFAALPLEFAILLLGSRPSRGAGSPTS